MGNRVRLTISAILLTGALVAVGLVDRMGRRRLILWMAPVLPLSVFAIGGLVHYPLRTWTGSILTTLA